MLSFFRRVSKSKIGTGIMATVLVCILAGFAIADISNFGSGNLGLGMGSSTLVRVGDQEVSERDMSDTMQRRLAEVRQQNPNADYATIAREFDTILNALIDQRTLLAFADKYGFRLSKRMIDAEIAQIPQTRGLDGKFSEQAYQNFLRQQRMTDAQVRDIIAGSLLQKLLITPIAANARISVGMAQPYASMLLEAREGEVAAVPIDLFTAGLKPTDADLQAYYAANRNRYIVPEQRVLRIARIGPEQVANVAASDQEIAAYFNANQATYGAKETRNLSQAVVADQATANAIVGRAKGAGSLAAAGGNAAVTSLQGQTRQAYASVAGDKVAAAAFAAPAGGVVGPIQSEFGWVVVKIDSVKQEGGKSLAAVAPEIAAKLNSDKRKNAIEDLVDRVQNSVDEGSNFSEAAAHVKLPIITTPLIMVGGTSRADPGYKLPADLAPALKSGFEIAPNDPPEVVTLPDNHGYALISPAEIVSAAPAPFSSIREQVAREWIASQALSRAKIAASGIAAKASRGMPLAQAARESGIALPAVRPLAVRRIQIAMANQQVPPPLQMLFTLAQGKSRMLADQQGRGFFIVKVNKIVPGNALFQPGLIGRMQSELQEPTSQDYAQQFLAAIREEIKLKRNESAIAAMKARLASGGS